MSLPLSLTFYNLAYTRVEWCEEHNWQAPNEEGMLKLRGIPAGIASLWMTPKWVILPMAW